MISMADWAVNKAPGGRTGLDNPRPTRSFVLFQGPPHPVTPPRSTRRQTVTEPQKTGHQASELRKVKGSALNPGRDVRSVALRPPRHLRRGAAHRQSPTRKPDRKSTRLN